MITFNYSASLGNVTLEVRSRAEHLGALVADFKQFLHHVGYHPDNIDEVSYTPGGGASQQAALPQQLDLFPEDETRS